MKSFLLLLLTLTWVLGLAAHTHPTHRSVTLANTFIDNLSEDQKTKALYAFADANRAEWTYLPGERQGLSLNELEEAQKKLLWEFVDNHLSDFGQNKTRNVIILESVLRDYDGQDWRDPGLYYISIFGDPAPTGAWSWRFEGHHVSLNFTFVEGEIAPIPLFYGSNPAIVPGGPHEGLELLKTEILLAKLMLDSMDAAQKHKSIYTTQAPRDILTTDDSVSRRLEDKGLTYSEMSIDQRELLLELIKLYLDNMTTSIAAERWDKIEAAGLEPIRFAWAGSTSLDEGHYWRIQGPTFLIEYDNVQRDANHAHTVWRDFEGDFGRDLLKEHHNSSH